LCRLHLLILLPHQPPLLLLLWKVQAGERLPCVFQVPPLLLLLWKVQAGPAAALAWWVLAMPGAWCFPQY
jgi:hypothetical protein